MKKQVLLTGIMVLLFTVWLSGCPEQGISIKKLIGEQPKSMNMTEAQMKQFPHLLDAIHTLTNGTNSVATPMQEMDELRALLKYVGTEVIQYQHSYYEIGFYAAD